MGRDGISKVAETHPRSFGIHAEHKKKKRGDRRSERNAE
jgi:hypothetical protein